MACVRVVADKTAAELTAENPRLTRGQMIVETDTGKSKVNFTSQAPVAWNSLPYFNSLGIDTYEAVLSITAPAADWDEAPLIVGETYTIATYETGDDFTNVGAASNAQDVEFIATGTTPTTWTNGSLLDSAGNPVVQSVSPANTLEDIVWTRNDVGEYLGTLEGAFAEGRTIIFVQGGSPSIGIGTYYSDDDTVGFDASLFDFATEDYVATDLETTVSVSIKVLPA